MSIQAGSSAVITRTERMRIHRPRWRRRRTGGEAEVEAEVSANESCAVILSGWQYWWQPVNNKGATKMERNKGQRTNVGEWHRSWSAGPASSPRTLGGVLPLTLHSYGADQVGPDHTGARGVPTHIHLAVVPHNTHSSAYDEAKMLIHRRILIHRADNHRSDAQVNVEEGRDEQ
jgi:hypothetical protein